MATLPPLVAINPGCFKYGAAGSSKLKATTHFLGLNKTIRRFKKVDTERRLFCGLVAGNVIRTPSRVFDFRVSATSRVSVEQTEQSFTTDTQVDDQQKASTYLFRTEVGDQVKVSVRRENANFAVYIEVSSFQQLNGNEGLVLSWGIFRGDSSCFMPLDFASNSKIETVETPFQQNSGNYTLELNFEAKHTPFYLSFSLKCDLNRSEIRTHRKTNFVVPVGFSSGSPTPLGLSFLDDGSVNFSFLTRSAKTVVLCLYNDSKADTPTLELDLDPYVNKSGDIWHASIENASDFVSYGYICKEDRNKTDAARIVLDPYTKVLRDFNHNHKSGLLPKYLGQVCKEPPFNWSGDKRLNLPIEKLMVYRLNVMDFTKHGTSELPTDIAGTFPGLTEKLHHFKDLGVNAMLLEPIFQFDNEKGPYHPFHFFSPMNLYSSSGESVSAINSMKEMVKKFHANNIEVLLEVVFTHTLDGEALRGIDDKFYYINGVAELKTRNALNCNYPIVQQMIVDSLRHWVTEFHIDGFCFINASNLLRDSRGESLSRPPLIESIVFDPILSKTKIIADFWDPHDLVDKETRFPHWKRWAEMNTNFCADVRNFLRGEGLLSDLATRLCGSGDIFSDGRGPAFSFNFITRNFGLSLVDLVSFSNINLVSELSWNCGEEGPTNKTAVLERRLKQVRNFLLILYISLGVPVLNMGDECGQSSGGSVLYGSRIFLDWNAMKSGFGIQMTQFIAFLTSLRTRRSDLLQKRAFLEEESVDWYGSDQSSPKWDDPSCKFLAMALKSDEKASDLFMAFNADDETETVILPPVSEGMAWRRLVDTALPFPGFFSAEGEIVIEQMKGLVVYEVKGHSCAVFEVMSSGE